MRAGCNWTLRWGGGDGVGTGRSGGQGEGHVWVKSSGWMHPHHPECPGTNNCQPCSDYLFDMSFWSEIRWVHQAGPALSLSHFTWHIYIYLIIPVLSNLAFLSDGTLGEEQHLNNKTPHLHDTIKGTFTLDLHLNSVHWPKKPLQHSHHSDISEELTVASWCQSCWQNMKVWEKTASAVIIP